MKIGIITMVGNENYGNLLQNYAVQRIIEQLGYEACTLNNETESSGFYRKELTIINKIKSSYIKNYIESTLSNSFGSKNDRDYFLSNLIKEFKNKEQFQGKRKERMEKLKLFRTESINYDCHPVDSEEFCETVKDYEAFVCGSDVIWHPTYHLDKKDDFLGFAPEGRRIAFAPSFGASEISEDRAELFKKWINQIDYLSVRDKSGAKIIKDLTGKDAKVLMDPTLCVDAEEWRKIEKKPKNADGKYVFCYFLGNMTKEYNKFITDYCKKNDYKAVYICDPLDLEHYSTSLEEFLWLIDNSECVFTDSFHGVVFSILFHKEFLAFKRSEYGVNLFTRIESLLSMLDIAGRRFDKESSDKLNALDYESIDKKLIDRRRDMINYLKDSLADIQTKEE
jgi:hypothetical protein